MITLAIIIVAAAVLPPTGYTTLDSFVAPGEALDKDHEAGRSRAFRLIFAGGIGLGMFSPLVAAVTGLSAVQMVTLFPAFNGVFGLPVTATFLFWAVNDRKVMGKETNTWKLNLVNVTLVLFAAYVAVRSGSGVLNRIFGGMLG